MKLIKSSKSLLIFLFLIAFVPRVYNLNETTIYPDEITWTVRSKEVFFAFKNHNINYFKTAWWTDRPSTVAIGLPFIWITSPFLIFFGNEQSKYSLNLVPEITAVRFPVALLSTLTVVIFYCLSKKIINPGIAFFCSLLLALDPIHIALSRWALQDSLLTFFTMLAVFTYAASPKIKFDIFLISIGLTGGFLTKPQGLLSLSTGFVLAIANIDNTKIFKKFLCGILLFILLTIPLWPANWFHPLTALIEYPLSQMTASQNNQNTFRNFFLGQVTNNPPFYYYLFQLITRLPTIIVLSIIFYPIILLYKTHFTKTKLKIFSQNFLPQISIAFFCLLFLILISVPTIKLGVRYILPLWPGIYLLAGWSLWQTASLLKPRILKILFIILILLSSLKTLIEYSPNYYLFYNELIGGPVNAQKYDLVGHCFDTKQALEYIKIQFPTIKSVAILGCSNVTAPYYFSGRINTNWQNEELVIVSNTYMQLSPETPAAGYFRRISPIYTINENGAILSRIYFKKR